MLLLGANFFLLQTEILSLHEEIYLSIPSPLPQALFLDVELGW
jgi:hypothetical protein